MQVFGPNELVEDVLKRDFCIGCGACVNLCPYVKSYCGKTAMLFPCTLSQGQCFAYCPKVEVDLDALSSGLLGRAYDGSPLGGLQEVLASRAGEKVEKGSFQAGGTVPARDPGLDRHPDARLELTSRNSGSEGFHHP